MDVQIDCGSIYFGLKQIKNIENNLNSFSSEMSKVTLPSELTTASLLNNAKTKVSSIINDDIKELIEIFEESKNILAQSDNHAALLFQYYEEGIIDEEGKFTDVPLLTQNDYPYIEYSQGSVETSGCGITSLCMVASYIFDKLYTPEDLAAIANADKSSNVGKMTTAADYIGLNWVCDSSTSREDLVNYLNEGKLVICLVKGSSHFVVCKGISEDGQILVNDPYLYFRNSATADGCTWSELQFSPGKTWIFDPTANTNATTSAGEISISEEVLNRLQNIEIDGVYETTVEADTNQNDVVKENSEDTTKDNLKSESTTQTDETTSNKDWASANNSSSLNTSNNSNNSNNSAHSNNSNNSGDASSSNNSGNSNSSNNSSHSNNSNLPNNSGGENNLNTKFPTHSNSNESPSDNTPETPTPDKSDNSIKNETTSDNNSTSSSTSNITNNKPSKDESIVKTDHSTSTDNKVLDQLISSTEGLKNNTGNSNNTGNPTSPKQEIPTKENIETIPDTKVDKPQIKSKKQNSSEPIINPAFIGAAMATLSVGAITVAERDKKNKKKTQS